MSDQLTSISLNSACLHTLFFLNEKTIIRESYFVFKGLHRRMAWLLRNCEHERHDGGLGWLVATPLSDVHLETVEEAQNARDEPEEAGNAGLAGLPKREHAQRLLGGCRKRYSHTHNNKQKTRTGQGYYSILDRYESLHLCG